MIIRLVTVATIVGALGCGASAPARGGLRAASLEGRQVGGVVILGNKHFPDHLILAGLYHRPPDGVVRWKYVAYSPSELGVDQKRIEAFYRGNGYFSAKASGAKAVRVGERVGIAFTVVENRRTRITSVRADGIPPESRLRIDPIAGPFGIAPGKPLVHDQYLAVKQRLEQALQRAGYAHAEVAGAIQVDRDRFTADIQFTVDPGPKVRFGQVHVEGNKRVPLQAIENRIEVDPGERFDPDKLERTNEQLRALSTFSSVRTEYEKRGRPEVADAYVQVAERTRHELKIGGGGAIDSASGLVRLRGDYANRMSIHPLVTVRGSLRPGLAVFDVDAQSFGAGAIQVESEVTLQRQDLLLPLLTGSISAQLDRSVFESYESFGGGGGVQLDRPVGVRRLTASLGWQFNTLFDITPESGLELGADAPYRIGYLTQSLTLDLRDSPIRTRFGLFAQLNAEEGHRALASEIDYLRATAELRGYVPLSDRLVFGARARGGVLDPRSDGDEPFTRRFYSGGSSSHRGFAFRRLSPEQMRMPEPDDEDQSMPLLPVGGNALFETSAELRLHLGPPDGPFSIAAFVDGGDVTAAFADLSTDLHWAAGGGLRLDTPAGPVRLDLGYRLNRHETGEPQAGQRFAFHFSIGEAF